MSDSENKVVSLCSARLDRAMGEFEKMQARRRKRQRRTMVLPKWLFSALDQYIRVADPHCPNDEFFLIEEDGRLRCFKEVLF